MIALNNIKASDIFYEMGIKKSSEMKISSLKDDKWVYDMGFHGDYCPSMYVFIGRPSIGMLRGYRYGLIRGLASYTWPSGDYTHSHAIIEGSKATSLDFINSDWLPPYIAMWGRTFWIKSGIYTNEFPYPTPDYPLPGALLEFRYNHFPDHHTPIVERVKLNDTKLGNEDVSDIEAISDYHMLIANSNLNRYEVHNIMNAGVSQIATTFSPTYKVQKVIYLPTSNTLIAIEFNTNNNSYILCKYSMTTLSLIFQKSFDFQSSTVDIFAGFHTDRYVSTEGNISTRLFLVKKSGERYIIDPDTFDADEWFTITPFESGYWVSFTNTHHNMRNI